MKGLRKGLLLLLAVSMIIGSLFSGAWALDEKAKDNPVTAEWNILDTLFARPLGIAAGIIGTGIFVAALPFTLPTGSVNNAAQMLIVEPFKFSFTRKFNDENQTVHPDVAE
ncbi:MAG: hypothetical protein ABSB22_07145 [Thermodesulfobacteriota bacterium]|jgi:hypothetical protein